MNKEELKEILLEDLRKLVGDKVDSITDIVLGSYSKTFDGKYLVKEKKVVVYPYETKRKMYPYSKILSITLHEVCHHLQYMDPDFVRLKGIMHNVAFWNMYNELWEKADKMKLFERRISYETK